MRLFVALPLPDPVRQQIVAVQETLCRIPADIRWVTGPALHLTLKFLSDVPAERLHLLAAAVRSAAAAVPSFAITIAGAGVFPGIDDPRVLWAGITEGAQELAFLAERIEAAAAAAGFPPERRLFAAHVTIGRFRSRQNSHALISRTEALFRQPLGTFTATAVKIMKSDCLPQGARYTCLETITLSLSTGTS